MPEPLSTTGVELLPTRSTYAPTDDVVVEVRNLRGAGELSTWHLGDPITTVQVQGSGPVSLGRLPAGGHGVELRVGDTVARTAVEVAPAARQRLRYGFVADYRPGRDISGVLDTVRRLHLDGIQFYDWAYRHADLLGGGPEYRDALDQPVTLAAVRALVAGLHEVGTDALGYAAVYAVGPQEWDRWQHLALQQSDGAPYALGDFLFLVDPAAPEWLTHLVDDLRRAVDELGFDGFHLDQYGYPRRAVRADGAVVDLSRSFTALISGVRQALPDARLVFNNVNDFPTAATARSPQDAVYIEVWDPHTTLGSLAQVVTRARAAGGGKPVVIAAYQHVYDTAPAAQGDLAASFTMATLFSHGATHLLAGEADRILVDPYYVRNHVVEASTAALLARWYDFLVEHDEILLDPGLVDVTGAWAGAYNEALDVTYAGSPVGSEPVAGEVWRRVTEGADGRLVIHLVNLAGQSDSLWDAPRATPEAIGAGTLRVRRVGGHTPRVRVADPDRSARLVAVDVVVDGEFATAQLPEPHVWQTVVVDLT